jgi:TPR repeat protein
MSLSQSRALGQRSLGRAYEAGEGVPRDDAEAVRWFRKAADQGDATGLSDLRPVQLGGRYSVSTALGEQQVTPPLWVGACS